MSQEEFNELVRKRVEQDENDPFYGATVARQVHRDASPVGVLAAAALVWLLLRMFGMFTMGIPGVVSSYLVGLLFAVVIALLGLPFSKDIRANQASREARAFRAAWQSAVVGRSSCGYSWSIRCSTFRISTAPSVIQRTNARVDWEVQRILPARGR